MSAGRHIASVLLLASSALVHAQQYPAKPIHIVVGFAAGGPTEVAARLVGQKLTDKWGQQVLVEARPGAGGNIAGEAVAKAAPDGYTLLLPAFAHAVNPTLYDKMPFETEKDFASVAMVATSANLFAVHPSVPATNLKELIALAKAQPGKLTFGSAGNGTASHLSGELLNSMAGIKLTHIPYKGSAPATTDLMGGHISSAFVSVANALPLLKSGKIKPIGVASLKRVDALPDLPTLSDAGVKGYEVVSWYGLLAPAKTPANIINMLNQEIVRATNEPDGVERLKTIGSEPSRMTPAELTAYIKGELVKWTKVIEFAGVTATD
jgi:tripartite-type tricarboxylate transporter receptor subunit TctC